MFRKIIISAFLVLPAISFAAPAERVEYIGTNTHGTLVIEDVRMTCERASRVYSELDIEIQSKASTTEIYKISIVNGKKYPEQEITLSKNGVETCRYLTKQEYSSWDSEFNFKIIDKVELGNNFCEGKEGHNLEFFPHSKNRMKFIPKIKNLGIFCEDNTRLGQIYREHLSLPLGKAGSVPEEMTILGRLKMILN